MASLRLRVSGMHCGHCVMKVEQALQKVTGVYGAAVDLQQGAAEVDFDPQKTKPDAFVTAVEAAGYGAEVGE